MNLHGGEVVLGALLELVVFIIGFLLGEFGGDLAGMSKDVLSGDTQEIVENVYPVLHVHRAVFLSLHFGEVEIQTHDAVKRLHLLVREIVLCYFP